MSGVKIKICGLTRAEDVQFAVHAGADAIGFVFAPGSKRELNTDSALGLIRSVPAFVTRVGLFLDQEADDVDRIIRSVPLNLLQFHGEEPAAYCRQFNRPYIKAVSMDAPGSRKLMEESYPDAAGLLLDSHSPGGLGGTGKTFDWSRIGSGRLPLILAGGLNPGNVARAIRTVRPWAVDVSSGVENGPGIKSDQKVREFITEARREY